MNGKFIRPSVHTWVEKLGINGDKLDYWKLLETTRDYWRILEITRDYWRLLGINWDCWRLLAVTGGYIYTGDYRWLLETMGDY